MTRAALIVASLLLTLPAAAIASTRYDPKLRFQTISTARFDIHYHQGEEAEARRLAEIAEAVAASLDDTLGPASGRVQVILVDQSDLPNGWATPVPFNTIEITAAAPGGDSLLGNTRDWLRLVFTHEYTHIVHLSRGRGWIGGLRRVLGRMPVLYPNLFLPVWQIEGIATYEESQAGHEGRVHNGSFRTILDVAAKTSRFDPIDRASGGLVDWPSGNAPYLYGSYFHDFLAAKYGRESIRQLTDSTSGRLPYLGSLAFRKVFKKPLGELWKEFEAASGREVPAFAPSIVRLTHHGFSVSGPRFGAGGRIYYSLVSPHEFPSLLSIDRNDRTPRKVADRYLGRQIAIARSRLIFDAVEVANHVGLQSDLFVMNDDATGKARLTHDARAADPDISPDGTTIVCTIQRGDRREIATVRLLPGGAAGAPVALVSEPGANFSSPRWSPDGRSIVAERGSHEIVLIDPIAKRVRPVAGSIAGRTATPEWLPDGRLLFASDREGEGFRLYRTDPDTSETWRLEGTGPDARSPAISPDGQSLVFVGYTANGYDLFLLPLESARWTRANQEVLRGEPPRAIPAPRVTATASAARPYSPWRTIAPRFWTPIVETDADELVAGAATASNDALGRHVYAVQAGWTTGRGRPDWQAAYAYDRWWPTIFANVSDDTDPWRGRELRTREINAGALLPFRRVRWTQSLLGAVHSSTDRLNCAGCGAESAEDITRTSIRGGWRLNASRAFGYSIGLEEGWSGTATTEITRRAFGSDGDGGAATFDVRHYLAVAPRHAVIASRFAAATTWGDASVRRVFSASGNGPQTGGLRFGSDAIGLLRGLTDDEIAGRHAIVANVDYRVPLWRIDRGAGTLPFFARVVHGAVFVDAGHAWDSDFHRADVLTSIGAELSLDAVVGYALPITFTAGAAWVSHDRGFAAFGRIGRSF
jgi:Tol biopolymer transport system component